MKYIINDDILRKTLVWVIKNDRSSNKSYRVAVVVILKPDLLI